MKRWFLLLALAVVGFSRGANARILPRPDLDAIVAQADIIAVVDVGRPSFRWSYVPVPDGHFARVERVIKFRHFRNQPQLQRGDVLKLQDDLDYLLQTSYLFQTSPRFVRRVQFQRGCALVFLKRSGGSWRGLESLPISDDFVGVTPLKRKVNEIERFLARDGASNFELSLLVSQQKPREW